MVEFISEFSFQERSVQMLARSFENANMGNIPTFFESDIFFFSVLSSFVDSELKESTSTRIFYLSPDE